ncbi:hypothetical protein SAMN05216552_1002249 [Pseudoduganella namucuonensis]|uniref:Uncharacterized protein n=1 Tax=Pseudoduganella namucuonensis TaxID=1035707 RepID=A0A1I7FS72_9BURK|nr:hypothetical protein SAMN05216552_1002249 [Pseudoduganella namucuonensis]
MNVTLCSKGFLSDIQCFSNMRVRPCIPPTVWLLESGGTDPVLDREDTMRNKGEGLVVRYESRFSSHRVRGNHHIECA